jgi:tetratricopeptide (TPR) repeat protein
MKKTIVVLFRQETPAVTRVLVRLRAHFGARRVLAAPGNLPTANRHALVVVLLSASARNGPATEGGLPLDDFAAWQTTGLDEVLVRDSTVLPMLLEATVMPAYTSIPEPFRKIAFLHALPIRCGEELDRDVGRLVSDVELHLRYSPGKVYAWDHWLVPLGMTGAVLSSPFLVFWLWDAWYWSYGYDTAARYCQACWWLTEFGPALLGLFLLLMAAGFGYRRYRRTATLRAVHYQTGQGELPPAEDRWLLAARLLTWTSIGWGWWTGVMAILALCGGVARTMRSRPQRQDWRTILFVITVSTLASAWGLWRGSVTNHLATALSENDAGRAALEQEHYAEAQAHFESAIDEFPRLGHSYEGLGLMYAHQRQNEAAYRELSRAVNHYATGDRGLFGPAKDHIVTTYRYRAQVARAMGQVDAAAADEKTAGTLTPFMDIFGGLLRFW